MRRLLLSAIALSLTLAPARADVTLPGVLGSHMVLQRDKPVTIWGWADPGEEVTVSFAGHEAKATANRQGDWRVRLPKMEANAKGQRLTVKGKNAIELDDVLVGEVWVGSGQSNMEWPMTLTQNAKERISAANHPNIRLYHIQKLQASSPLRDVPVVNVRSSWKACTPETVPNFSAVLYYFGARLQKDLDVPIGLINSSWGGSPIEQWITGAKTPAPQMYNGMIAPIAPLAIRGVIWYQGESNVSQGLAYLDKKKALIEGWRKFWGKEMPFYFVQIAPFSGYGKGFLPALWEAQVATLKIPNTGMAVTTDLVDNIADIHPQNKLDVGHRLALWALAKTYGKKDVVYSGPLYKSMKVEGNKAVLSFAQVGGGLKARDDKPLTGFEVAGEDGKFVPAEAVIDGETVVVSSKDVSSPAQVRFGWNNVANPNLMNKEGLPASPFQTKDWKGGTGE
ncbi:MAG: sialate O-acetylesterase [Gemmataceae bacterium]